MLSRLAEEFHKLAFLDPLTGLFNRRYIEQSLVQEIARCQRHESALTVMLFDLDSFKEVNDAYGHSAGDRALTEFAERLRKATRGADVAGRYMVVMNFWLCCQSVRLKMHSGSTKDWQTLRLKSGGRPWHFITPPVRRNMSGVNP